MYIGIGTVVLIIIIVLVILMLRRLYACATGVLNGPRLALRRYVRVQQRG